MPVIREISRGRHVKKTPIAAVKPFASSKEITGKSLKEMLADYDVPKENHHTNYDYNTKYASEIELKKDLDSRYRILDSQISRRNLESLITDIGPVEVIELDTGSSGALSLPPGYEISKSARVFLLPSDSDGIITSSTELIPVKKTVMTYLQPYTGDDISWKQMRNKSMVDTTEDYKRLKEKASAVSPKSLDWEKGYHRGSEGNEVFTENVFLDGDPFGVVRMRKRFLSALRNHKYRFGGKAYDEEFIDLVLRSSGGRQHHPAIGYYDTFGPAGGMRRSNSADRLDALATRTSLVNKVDKRGDEHLTFNYRGFDPEPFKGKAKAYGSFLSQGQTFSLKPHERNLFKNTTLDPTSTYGYSRQRRNRYRHDNTSWVDRKRDSRPLIEPSQVFQKYRPTAAFHRYSDVNAKPFGLEFTDFEDEDDGCFQTVNVKLKNNKFRRDDRDYSLPKIKLHKHVFMDDLDLKLPNIRSTDYVRRTNHGILDNVKYSLIPRERHSSDSYAQDMSRDIVDSALDRIFGICTSRLKERPEPGVPICTHHQRIKDYDSSLSSHYRAHSPAFTSSSTRGACGMTGKAAGGYGGMSTSESLKSDMERHKKEREEERRRLERKEEERRHRREQEDLEWKRKMAQEEEQRNRRNEERRREETARRREDERESEERRKAREEKWEEERRRQEAEWKEKRSRREEEETAFKLDKFDPRVHIVEDDTKRRMVQQSVVEEGTQEQNFKYQAIESKKVEKKVRKVKAESDHDPGEVINDREPGIWEGHGHFKDERVIFNSNTGYIHWTKPKGSLEVIFKHPDGKVDFRSIISPKHKGMKVFEVREDAEVLIANGRGSPESLEFVAIDGVVVIVIETYEEEEELPELYHLDWKLV